MTKNDLEDTISVKVIWLHHFHYHSQSKKIKAKLNIFSQVIKKGLLGGEEAIKGKYLTITEMAHLQKKRLQC